MQRISFSKLGLIFAQTAFWSFLLIHPAFSQGILVVQPMADVTSDRNKSLGVDLYGQTETPLEFKVELQCDIDGIELSDDQCENYFQINTGKIEDKYTLTLKQGDKIRLTVALNPGVTVKKYAVLKPLIAPVKEKTPPKKSAVAFDFRYQPGFFYLFSTPEKNLESAGEYEFKTVTDKLELIFKEDLSGLDMPVYVNMSAKILRKSDLKMLKFVKIAKEKILDPRRSQLLFRNEVLLGQEYKATSPKDLCIQVVVQDVLNLFETYTQNLCKN